MEESNKVLSADAHCILLHGPPFVGKTQYAVKTLREVYSRVCPEEIFKSQPELSVRQLIQQYIVQPLKQAKRVAIDASSQTSDIRRSYFDAIRNKVPEVKFLCVVLEPAHGFEQLLWQQELRAAECYLMGDMTGCQNILSTSVLSWYQKHDTVSTDEGFDIIKVKTQLCLKAPNKPSTPCLLMDWPLEINKALIDALTYWQSLNRSGRIVALPEPCNSSTGNLLERLASAKSEIARLTDKLPFPVYVFICADARSTSSLFAFLLQSLCVDLGAPSSVCVYNGSVLRAAAQSVGMKCIKASRLLQNHTLIRHGLERGGSATMLRDLQIDNTLLDEKLREALKDPLWACHAINSSSSCSRAIYLSARDRTVLTRYKEIHSGSSYQFSAQDETTPVNELSSTNNTSLCTRADWSVSKRDSVRSANGSRPSSECKRIQSGKQLPQWMRSSGAKQAIFQHGVHYQPGRLRRSRLNNTVYMMSESELVKAAAHYIKNFKEEEEIRVVLDEENTELLPTREVESQCDKSQCCESQCDDELSLEPSHESTTDSKLPNRTKENVTDLQYQNAANTLTSNMIVDVNMQTEVQAPADNTVIQTPADNTVIQTPVDNTVAGVSNNEGRDLVTSSWAPRNPTPCDDDNFDEFLSSLV